MVRVPEIKNFPSTTIQHDMPRPKPGDERRGDRADEFLPPVAPTKKEPQIPPSGRPFTPTSK